MPIDDVLKKGIAAGIIITLAGAVSLGVGRELIREYPVNKNDIYENQIVQGGKQGMMSQNGIIPGYAIRIPGMMASDLDDYGCYTINP